MAEERTTLVTLRKALAEKTGCTEQEAGNYLNQLFASIVSGLKEDGQVRIAGLGIFKTQWNAPRRSVNIQTGEPITIEGYYKVAFVPETALKERINEPFAHLESIVIEGNGNNSTESPVDPMQKLDEQAAEIKDLLAELGAVTTTAPEAETPLKEEETKDAEETAPETTPDTTQEAQVEPVDIAPQPDSTPIPTPIPTDVPTPAPQEPVAPKTQKASKLPKQERPFHPWMAAGITMLVFCLLLTGGYFFLQHKITSWADNMLTKSEQPASLPANTPAEQEEQPASASDTPDSIVADTTTEETIATPPTEIQGETKQPRTYQQFITTETLTEGSRLTWLSRKYYGAPDFWVYIYEANKDILPDPNNISVGTQIRIPKLPNDLIDLQNEASLQQARQLHEEILGQQPN